MTRRILMTLLVLMVGCNNAVRADDLIPELPTPPRVSMVSGQVSLWRPAAQAWQASVPNLPLAVGDLLESGANGSVEIQVGAQAWLRAANSTRFAIADATSDTLRITLSSGTAALDVRSLANGQVLEVSTPHATLSIRFPGYYRIGLDAGSTSAVVRRGGFAQASFAGPAAGTIGNGELAVFGRVQGMERFAAPADDAWDRWNYAQGDQSRDSLSASYVTPGVYGLAELDRNGVWQVATGYGPVWIPTTVPPGWAPYSTGRWIADPVYGWTWLDNASWGYAPFHYGRWVNLSGTWAWAPGPRQLRASYSPALVGWTGTPVAGTGWVALGWGEPVRPWWGPSTFVGRPHWGGWGGPRVLDHDRARFADGTRDARPYVNAQDRNAIIAGSPRHFLDAQVRSTTPPPTGTGQPAWREHRHAVPRVATVTGHVQGAPAAPAGAAAGSATTLPVAAATPSNTAPVTVRPATGPAVNPHAWRHDAMHPEPRAGAAADAPRTPPPALPPTRTIPPAEARDRSAALPLPVRPTAPAELPRPADRLSANVTPLPPVAPMPPAAVSTPSHAGIHHAPHAPPPARIEPAPRAAAAASAAEPQRQRREPGARSSPTQAPPTRP